MRRLLLFALTIVALASCGHYKDGTSVWADYMGVLEVALIFFGLFFIWIAWRASRSNSTQQTPGGIKDNTGNVKIYKLGKFWFGVVILLTAVVVAIVQNVNK